MAKLINIPHVEATVEGVSYAAIGLDKLVIRRRDGTDVLFQDAVPGFVIRPGESLKDAIVRAARDAVPGFISCR